MGCTASKLEKNLMESPLFNSLVETSFQDSVSIAHHSSPSSSIYLFQLLEAVSQIYHLIPPAQPKTGSHEQEQDRLDSGSGHDDDDVVDVVSLLKARWLPFPPSQSDVDRTLRREESLSAKTALSREEFFFFARCLFRDMAIVSAEQRLIVYVPTGAFVVVCTHLALGRLPFVGPMYRSVGLLTPGVLLGSVIGAFAALGSRFP